MSLVAELERCKVIRMAGSFPQALSFACPPAGDLR